MSYNNFSYYNGPESANQWWTPKNPPRSAFEESLLFDSNKPQLTKQMSTTNMSSSSSKPYSQGTRHNYSANIVLSKDNRVSGPDIPRYEVVRGKVTKLFSNLGYVNDNILFSKSEVIGSMVQVGDKVSVDAIYQSSNPSKYRGERVYKIDESRFSSDSNTKYGKMKTLSQGSSSMKIGSSMKDRMDNKYGSSTDSVQRIGANTRTRGTGKYSAYIRSDTNSREYRPKRPSVVTQARNISAKVKLNTDKAKPQPEQPKVEKPKETPKIDLSRKTEAVKRKVQSPIRIEEATPVVMIAKNKPESKEKCTSKNFEYFGHRELDCATVKNLYSELILPKEFFHVSLKYQQSFPLNHPMKLGNDCHFKIMDKKVRAVDRNIDSLLRKPIDPADADTTFTVKVMLPSTDDLAKFYKDTLTVCEENEGGNNIPIMEAIHFLIGSVGSDKEFAIGGAWSPSLDGADPESNPRVLINTAIRTCKAMTGIDLSNCSSWPKFLELHYYRPLQKKENSANITGSVGTFKEPGKHGEPRMETVVYYIPDIWNCVPSPDGWQETKRLYQEQLMNAMCPPPVKIKSKTSSAASSAKDEELTNIYDDEEDWDCNDNECVENNKSSKNSDTSVTGEQPTHFSKLLITGMKIVQIKKELELRKLNNRGVMEQLKARLKSALDKEEAEEKTKEVRAVVAQPVVKEGPQITLSDDQKNELRKLYRLPVRPEIIVFQNQKIHSGQLELRTVSLHSLMESSNTGGIDENVFELVVFAKQFVEMLRRDAVFNVYKSIVVVPAEHLNNIDDPAKKAKLSVSTSKRTVNKPLLFSCTLLDREKTNKISLEELTTLIEGLGICLSSDQLSSVLDKVKDSSKYLNYRQLTDRVVTNAEINKSFLSDVTEDLDYTRELSMGNRALFDVDPTSMNASMNDDDTERLKNALDKTERYRQTIELRVAQVNDEAEKKDKEINTLQEQIADYRTKYENEQMRCDKYRLDLDKLLSQIKEADKLSMGLNQLLSATVAKYMNEGKNDVTSNVEKCNERAEGTVKNITVNTKIADRVVAKGSGNETVKKNEIGKQIPSIAKCAAAIHHSEEDFDFSKPSDYDMIILDETD